jgi:RND family efflux transporter MFP subunit
MKRFLGILVRIALLVLLLVGMVAAGRKLIARKRQAFAKSPKFELAAAPVDVVSAYRGDLDEGHDYLAVTEPVRTATISARITAAIERVHVQEGVTVAKGDVLVTLDNRQFRDGLAAMEAQIAQAEAELAANEANVASLKESAAYWDRERERDRKLAEGETIPRAQAEATAEKANEARGRLTTAKQKSVALEQQVRALQRKADELRTTLSYCTVTSPFAGMVTVKQVDPGDLAAPGKTLLIVEDRSSVKLAFDVPQSDLPAFREGLPAAFSVNGANRSGRVTRVYPSLSRARMVRAEIILSGTETGGLPLGAYMDVTVVFRRCEQATLIPVDAVITNSPETAHVFVVRDGVLDARPVKVLGRACEVAAVEGIAPGEQVVVSSFLGWARLSDGMKVEARL